MYIIFPKLKVTLEFIRFNMPLLLIILISEILMVDLLNDWFSVNNKWTIFNYIFELKYIILLIFNELIN